MGFVNSVYLGKGKGSRPKNISQKIENVHIFPDLIDKVDWFEFGKYWKFDDPPRPELANIWNANIFETVARPLALV